MAGELTAVAALITAVTPIAKPAVETACEMLKSLLGEPLKVASAMLADEVYLWRWENRIKIANRAKEIADREGIPLRVIPRPFLLPLVDAAGDAEDPTLQDMWARLLASAVADDINQHPSFIGVLKQLSPLDARLLALVRRPKEHSGISGDYISSEYSLRMLAAVVSWELQYVKLAAENLCRLGLCDAVDSVNGSALTMTAYGAAFAEASSGMAAEPFDVATLPGNTPL